MTNRVVYFNGRLVPEWEARVSIYDSGLIMGDMAFEVSRTCGHRPYKLEEHLRRLYETLARLEIDPGLSLPELLDVTLDTLRQNLPTEAEDVDWNVIHNVSRGPQASFRGAFAADELRPTVIVSCYPLVERLAAMAPAFTQGVDMAISRQRALPAALLPASLKTRSRLHYQLANLEMQRRYPGAFALLLDPDGYLAEGTSGNVFLVRGGELCTPSKRNILPGITREVVLELARTLGIPACECDLSPDDARMADELFLTSTSIGILHARSFDGLLIGDGRPGPLTQRLRAALYQDAGLDFAAQAARYAARLRTATP